MLERQAATGLTEAMQKLCAWMDEQTSDEYRRLEIEIPCFERLELDLYPRIRWRSRDGELEIQAFGCALQAELGDWTRNDSLLDDLGNNVAQEAIDSLRWFLWGRFDAMTIPDPEWQELGSRRLLLPSLEVRREKGRCLLACNRNAQGLPALTAALNRAQTETPSQMLHAESQPTVSPDDWAGQVGRVQELLAGSDELQKVVLARYRQWRVAGFDPEAMLREAAELQPDSFQFLIQLRADSAFFGLSPERLFWRRGNRVVSEALAGTRTRGESVAEDEALGRELLDSEKDRREQRLVLEQILTALEPMSREMDHDKHPHLRKLQEVQHLCNEVRAELKPGLGDGDLLAALHPTPAVAGQPAREARAVIAGVESFDRGLYAGPVGCCSMAETEVAVAIRSALWSGDTLRLYAGAGLLPASGAEAEWEETEAKMGLLTRLLVPKPKEAQS